MAKLSKLLRLVERELEAYRRRMGVEPIWVVVHPGLKDSLRLQELGPPYEIEGVPVRFFSEVPIGEAYLVGPLDDEIGDDLIRLAAWAVREEA